MQLTPLVIVAIVVSYIVSARLNPVPSAGGGAADGTARGCAVVTRPCESMSR